MDLGRAGGEGAASALQKALGDGNRRVRRAAAVALGECGAASAAGALRRAVETDAAEDVVGASEIALGRLGTAGTREFLTKQLSRESRWWDSIRFGALAGLGKLRDPSLAPLFEKYTDPRQRQEVRAAALAGWEAAAPDDPKLAETFRRFTSDRNRQIREDAVRKVGERHGAQDLTLLRKLSEDPDPTVADYAREGIEETQHFTGAEAKK